jgi:hypothetical protein
MWLHSTSYVLELTNTSVFRLEDRVNGVRELAEHCGWVFSCIEYVLDSELARGLTVEGVFG